MFSFFVFSFFSSFFLLHLLDKKYKFFFIFQILKVLSWNIRDFLSLKLETSISWNIRSIFRVVSFYFLSSELFFAKLSIVNFWQCSEYVSDSKSTRFLNMLLVLNMSGFWIYLSQNIRRFLFLKYKNFFGVSVSRKLVVFRENLRNFFRAGFLGENIRYFLREKNWGTKLESVLVSSIIYYYFHVHYAFFSLESRAGTCSSMMSHEK